MLCLENIIDTYIVVFIYLLPFQYNLPRLPLMQRPNITSYFSLGPVLPLNESYLPKGC